MGCTYRPRLLPGTTGWQARRPPNAGAQTDPPVPCSAVHTFRSPYARRFFRAASPRSPPVPWPSPYRKGLGSASFHPQNGGTRHDAAGFFTIRTACSLDPQRSLCRDASTLRISPRAGHQLHGCLVITVAGPRPGKSSTASRTHSRPQVLFQRAST